MSTTTLSSHQKQEIQRQVGGFLGRTQAFRGLSTAQQRQIAEDTARLVEKLAESPHRASADPYAMPLGTVTSGADGSAAIDTSADTVTGNLQGNTAALLNSKQAQMGNVVAAGVTQAARMIHEIDFPAFVASLIHGTFHAIVKSSIEQMRAYAEMVKSVSTSLNDFKDQNTTDNQARDSLVQRYPQHFQLTIEDGKPKVGMKDGADDLPVPDFQKDLGMSEGVESLDQDTVEQKLVPAARDDLARGRQQLLATVILMGINRIVVTDGKINAKIKFQFSATEKQQMTATAFDYVKTGNIYNQSQGSSDSGSDGTDSSSSDGSGAGATGAAPDGSGTNYAKGQYQSSVMPDVRVTSQVDTSSTGALTASGNILGEVSINFKSETFPLEKMVDSGQMMQLQNAQQGAGRGAPPAGARAAPSATPVTAAPAAAPSK